ncbi:MAG: lipid A-modifier LpxR family protein [Fulvivirga sp.]
MTFWLLWCYFSCHLTAQDRAPYDKAKVNKRHRMDRELEFTYDNDLIFFTDRYYTSGTNIAYSRLIKPSSNFYRRFSSKRMDSSKLITRYHYGHRIYTPKEIKERDVEEFDRPYAGWHYGRFELLNFPSEDMANKYSIDIGLVGEKSGIGNLHEWWHKALGLTPPRGWQYEIASEPLVNFSYNRIKNWRIIKKVKLITNTGASVGNRKNKFEQEFLLRIGKFNELMNSSVVNSRVDDFIPELGYYPKDGGEEGFFFYSISGSWVLSNILIEGSVFNNESPQTEEADDFVITRKWGFVYSNYYTTFSFTVYRIGEEVIGGRVHRYLNLNLAVRF